MDVGTASLRFFREVDRVARKYCMLVGFDASDPQISDQFDSIPTEVARAATHLLVGHIEMADKPRRPR